MGTFGNGHELKEFRGSSDGGSGGIDAVHDLIDSLKPRRGWSDLKGALSALAAENWGEPGRKKLLVFICARKRTLLR